MTATSIIVLRPVSSTVRRISVTPSTVASSPKIDFAVPASQLYYWSYTWQTNQAAAEHDYAEGKGVHFDDVSGLLSWLERD
jgi:hypothetical protein